MAYILLPMDISVSVPTIHKVTILLVRKTGYQNSLKAQRAYIFLPTDVSVSVPSIYKCHISYEERSTWKYLDDEGTNNYEDFTRCTELKTLSASCNQSSIRKQILETTVKTSNIIQKPEIIEQEARRKPRSASTQLLSRR